MTALPQPPNVSQNVPIASAAYFFMLMQSSTKPCAPTESDRHWPHI